MAISSSNPSYRFDRANAVSTEEDLLTCDAKSMDEINRLINDPSQPIILFALEWCEFCWSVRKVLKAYGIDYQAADLDAVKFQHDDLGGKMRVALRSKTGWNTFPQIFIKGEFIEGCTDLFDGLKDGTLINKLHNMQIPMNSSVTVDPYSLLPSWLHPR